MVFLEELAKCEKGENGETHPVYDCIKIVRDWPEPDEYKLLFYFFGSIKGLKEKLSI